MSSLMSESFDPTKSPSPSSKHHHYYRHNRRRRSRSHSHEQHIKQEEDWSYDPDNITLQPRRRPTIKSEPLRSRNTHKHKSNDENSKHSKHDFDEDKAWNEAESEIDRRWYLQEIGTADPEYNPFGGNDDSFWSTKQRKKQKQIDEKKKNRKPSLLETMKEKWAKKEQNKKKKKNLPRITQLERDNAKWEEQMLYRSGVVTQVNESEMMFDDEVEHTTHILVRDMKPPFLDGRQQFSTQLKPISVVKDETSDMAVIARKGSHTLHKWRENRDKKKISSHEKWWEGKLLNLEQKTFFIW